VDGAKAVVTTNIFTQPPRIIITIIIIIKVKVKVKFTPEQATKSQRGSRGIALLFL